MGIGDKMKPGDQIQYIGKAWMGEIFTFIRSEVWAGQGYSVWTQWTQEDGKECYLTDKHITGDDFRPFPVKVPEYKEGDVIRVVRDLIHYLSALKKGTVFKLQHRTGERWKTDLPLLNNKVGTVTLLNNSHGFLHKYPECFVIESRKESTVESTSTEDYSERQGDWLMDCKLDVGSKVRVTRRAMNCEGGWNNDWLRHSMDKSIGKELEIIDTGDGRSCGIRLSDGWWYPYFVLCPAEDCDSSEQNKSPINGVSLNNICGISEYSKYAAETPSTVYTAKFQTEDGRILEMPGPGEEWEKGETEKQGWLARTSITHDETHGWMAEIDNRFSLYSPQSSAQCWLKDMHPYVDGSRCLEITDWTRKPNRLVITPQPYTYYCPSRNGVQGRWPGSKYA